MPFASKADYRRALSDHRSWPVTAAVWLGGFVAAMLVFWVPAGVTGHGDSMSLLVVGVLAGGVVAWMDAAHRVASKREHSGRL